ncbi:periplasmic binding protein-like II, partial [Anaeromyces robustus]
MNILYIIIIVILSITSTYSIDIHFVSFLFNTNNVFEFLTKEFNKYAKENNLDITLRNVVFTYSNSTSLIKDYGSSIESLMNKKSVKYDIYMFDSIYTNKYSPFLLDLGKTINTTIINNFDKDLPLYLNFGILYSNKSLLDKYNKKPPKTWDELLEMGTYILEKENITNVNNGIIGYAGHMPEYETSVCSSMEFIHSFRDNIDSPIPSFKSLNAEKAFDKIKELKNKLSTDDYFLSSDFLIVFNLLFEKILFARYWDNIISKDKYYVSRLPGEKEDISTSCISGLNVGINKFSSIENQNASLEVLNFFFSEEIQKKLLLENQLN